MRSQDGPAEKRLAYLEGVVDNLGGVVWEFDWPAGAFTYVSDAAERMLGYTADEWLKPGFWVDHLHPDDLEWAADYCKQLTQAGQDHEFEYRMIHRDGSIVWVRDIVTVDPEKGLSGCLRGILIDVTAHRLAEERLAIQAADFDAVFRAMGDLYLKVGSDNIVLDAKIPGDRVMSLDSGTVLGHPVTEAVPAALSKLVTDNIALARQTGTMVITEHRFSPGERQRFHEARFLPLEGGEVVIVSRDVTDRHDAAEDLSVAKERYRTLVDMSPYAILVVTLEDVVVFANAAAEALFGYGEGDSMLGVKMTQTHLPERPEDSAAIRDVERVKHEMRLWMPGKPPPTAKPMRRVIRMVDGTERLIERSGAGIRFRGEPAMLILARDITDEVEAERVARAAEERFRSVVEQAPFGAHLYETRDGELVFAGANSAAERILGADTTGFVGLGIEEAFPGLTGTEVPETYRRLAREGGSWHTEQHAYEDGRISGTFEVHALQISRGRVAVLFTDVTERTRAAEALRLSESRLLEAQEIAHLGHYVFRIADDWWDSSPALDKVFGIGEEYVRDFNGWLGIVHEEDRAQMRTYVTEQVLGARLPFDREYRITRQDTGETRWVHGGGSLEFDDDGAPVRLFGTIHDITDHKLAQQAERRYAERLSAMAAELTATEDHERRRLAEELHDRVSQALAVARMHLASVEDESGHCDREVIAKAVSFIESAIEETRAITTDLAPPVLYELGLGPALRWQCEQLAEKMGIEAHLVADVDESGVADEAKMVLFRAARELLVNVYKHSGTREAWVSLDSVPGWLVMTVTDNGSGFDAETRGSAGTGSSGFGLFSIRDRLPHLGGEFDVATEPGEGTVVTLKVPRASA